VSTNVLTIAGTDPSGGAGIQADLKTFSALTTYGLSVITAVVAQNTRGVDAIHPIPAEFVAAQIESVFDDIRVDAVKVGMLGDIEVVRCVAAALRRHRPRYVVVDPVMVASSGERLLASDAVAALRTELLPTSTSSHPTSPKPRSCSGRRKQQTRRQWVISSFDSVDSARPCSSKVGIWRAPTAWTCCWWTTRSPG